ncbi:MAG: hypothetical protein QXX77_10655 [Candidatus Methanosuratincola sp.]|jgi:hypothetical protein
MPAKIITVRAKTKKALEQLAAEKIREAAKKGFEYVKEGYKESRIRKVKGGYEIDISVHS